MAPYCEHIRGGFLRYRYGKPLGGWKSSGGRLVASANGTGALAPRSSGGARSSASTAAKKNSSRSRRRSSTGGGGGGGDGGSRAVTPSWTSAAPSGNKRSKRTNRFAPDR